MVFYCKAQPWQIQYLSVFSDGINESVPCSYIEFAERLVLPQYKNLPKREILAIFSVDRMHKIKESHRQDRFEVKIFESTSREQLTRRV
ncbi:hypothetical protein V6N13_115883 [Hibiscus sabdariffa]